MSNFRKTYTIKAGRSWSWPLNFKRFRSWVQKFSIQADSGMNWVYRVEGVNQYDWNTLLEFRNSIFRPKQGSIKLVWKYNPTKTSVDFACMSYTHGVRSVSVPLSVPFDHMFTNPNIAVTFDNAACRLYIEVSKDARRIHHTTMFDFNVFIKNKPWLITHQFGESEVSPKDLIMHIERVW